MSVDGGRQRATRPIGGLAVLRAYQPAWLRADVLAGITVTAYLVPQCLAYADLAGASPVTGLWAAVVAMIAYALIGTSRQLSVGPESATAVMVATAVAPLATGDPARYLALSAALAILVPSGLTATSTTGSRWPVIAITSSPVSTSKTRTLLSWLPVTSILPPWAKVREETVP